MGLHDDGGPLESGQRRLESPVRTWRNEAGVGGIADDLVERRAALNVPARRVATALQLGERGDA